MGRGITRGRVRRWLRRPDGLGSLVGLRSRDRENLVWLAYRALIRNNANEAETLYRSGLSLWPDDLALQLGLGVCLQLKGDHSGAETLYAAVLAVDPSCLHALANQAELCVMTARQDEARGYLDTASKISPRLVRKAGLEERLSKLLELTATLTPLA